MALAAGGLTVPTVLGDTIHGTASGHYSGGGELRAFPFSDTFDSYSPGTFPCTGGGCAGPNGWSIWYSGGQPGQIVSGTAQSGTNFLQEVPAADITQTGSLTSGQYTVRAYQYSPTSDLGNAYFIVMNSYNGTPGLNTWSIEIEFNGTTGSIRDDINGVYPPPAQYTGPIVGTMVRDQWVEVRAEINLNTNRYNFFYNGVQLINNQVYTPTTSPVPTPGIYCLDLYSDTSTSVRYDTVSVQAVGGGGCYPNCDGSTAVPFLNVADFSCFLTKYAAGNSYANCDGSTSVPVLNVADFSCFLTKYATGCSAP
jgi:hypothetical protein